MVVRQECDVTFRFRPTRVFSREVSRIALEELHRAMAVLSNEAECINRRIHESRRSFKRLRALCRLAEPADPAFFKDARSQFSVIARSLAAMRDAQAHVECCKKMEPWILSDDVAMAFQQLEQALVARRDAAVQADLPQEIDTIVKTCQEQKAAFEKWNLPAKAKSTSGTIRKAWHRAIVRAVTACKNSAAGTDENAIHDLRKASQNHLQQMILLADLWPSMFAMRMERVRELTALLGEEHDIYILRTVLGSEPDLAQSRNLIETALMQRQTTLRENALVKAAVLFDLDADMESERVACLWQLAAMN
jgi:CHAD domain